MSHDIANLNFNCMNKKKKHTHIQLKSKKKNASKKGAAGKKYFFFIWISLLISEWETYFVQKKLTCFSHIFIQWKYSIEFYEKKKYKEWNKSKKTKKKNWGQIVEKSDGFGENFWCAQFAAHNKIYLLTIYMVYV